MISLREDAMERSLLILAAGLFCLSASAAVEPAVALYTELSYQDGGKAVKLDHTVVLTSRARTWVPLIPPSGNLTLLGRLAQKDGDRVRVEYILLDSSKKNPVVATPSIISKMHLKTELQDNSSGRKVSIALTPGMIGIERKSEE